MNENKPKKWEWKKVTHKEKNKTSLDKNKKLLSAPTNMNLIVIVFPLLCRLEEKKKISFLPSLPKTYTLSSFQSQTLTLKEKQLAHSFSFSSCFLTAGQSSSTVCPCVRLLSLSVCPSHLCNLRGYEHTHGQKRKAKKKRGEKLLWLNPRTKLFSLLAICTYKDTIPD